MSLFTLYRIYAGESLLYVGMTTDIGRRLEQHVADKPWWAEATEIRLEHLSSADALSAAERAAIQTERPLHNIRMNQGTKAEQRKTLRDNGWTRIGRGGAESWKHPDKPHTYTLAAAFYSETREP